MYFAPTAPAAGTSLAIEPCASALGPVDGSEISIERPDGLQVLATKDAPPHMSHAHHSRVSPAPLHGSRPISLESSFHDENSPPAGPPRTSRPAHTRSLSATVSKATAPFICSDSSSRTRAASVAGSRPSSSKANHLYTMTLTRALLPRVRPVASVATEPDETIGSFSPTSCPRQQLHNILEALVPPHRRRQRLTVVTRLRKTSSESSDVDAFQPTSPVTPPLSPIPSICRTPSSYSESEYFPTAPSSAGPATPVHSAVSSPLIQNKSLRPILEALEDASKFRVRTACAACGKQGSNYPCCPRCGEMWCSRACRLQSSGGKRHVCRS